MHVMPLEEKGPALVGPGDEGQPVPKILYKDVPDLTESSESSATSSSDEDDVVEDFPQIEEVLAGPSVVLSDLLASSPLEGLILGDDNGLVDDTIDSFPHEEADLANLNSPFVEKKSGYGLTSATTTSTPGVVETDAESSTSVEGHKASNVRFSTVSIRVYSLTVGNTPGSKPYPLMLDWEHTETDTLDLDQFEEFFCAAKMRPSKKVMRGFCRPRRLSTNKRFRRLVRVTGKKQDDLYELEHARVEEENKNPCTAVSFDDVYIASRRHPYEVVDIDGNEYEIVDI